MRRVLLIVFASFCAVGAFANPFEYTWQQLAPSVWAGIRQDPFELPQEGNSMFVVTGDGVVVFDAGGSPLMGESIVAKVKSVTSHPQPAFRTESWFPTRTRPSTQCKVPLQPYNGAILF